MKTPRTDGASAVAHRTMKRVAVASLLALAGSSATALDAVAAQPVLPSGIAVQPASSSHLSFVARPGSVLTGAVRVRNTSRQARTVRLSTADIGTAQLGGAVYGDGAGRRIGGWLSLQSGTVKVPPHGNRIVRFRVRVPAGATSGVHYAGITAVDAADLRSARTAAKGGSKSIVFHRIERMALPIRLQVPGHSSPRLVARGAKVAVNAAGANALLTLENTGRRLILNTGVDLRVVRGARTIARAKQPMREFVPDSSTAYPVAIPGVPAAGDYRLVGQVKPAGAPVLNIDEVLHVSGNTVSKARRSLQNGTARPATSGGISIFVWIALGGGTAAFAVLLVAFARMRRRLKEATATQSERS